MGTMARYTNEMRERAVRMVAEVRPEHPHETAALRHVAGLLGMNVETLRLWVHRAQIDAGVRPGTTSEDAEEIKRLKREVAELRRANEILKSASVFFAKELDRPTTR
jgi:transposase